MSKETQKRSKRDLVSSERPSASQVSKEANNSQKRPGNEGKETCYFSYERLALADADRFDEH